MREWLKHLLPTNHKVMKPVKAETKDDKLNNHIQYLYELYGRLIGTDQVVLKASKMDALRLMNSEIPAERLKALLRMLYADPNWDEDVEPDELADAIQEAENTTREQLATAREQIEQEKNRARQDIAIERDRAMNSLRNEVVSLSVAMAGKVVAKDMNSETNTKLIEDAIRQLDSKTIGL